MSTTTTELWVMTAPVLSTAHLRPTTLATLSGVRLGHAGPGEMYVVPMTDGFMVYNTCASTVADPTIPQDLRDALHWALDNGYEWVRFDGAGTVIAALASYEHR